MSSETIGQTQHYPGFRVDVKILDSRLNEPEYRLKHDETGSAAIDLRACIKSEFLPILPNRTVLVPTGFSMKMSGSKLREFGIVPTAILLSLTGIGHKRGIVLGNGTGLVEYDNDGQVMVSVHNRSINTFVINPMDRICQMLCVPVFAPIQFNVVEDLN